MLDTFCEPKLPQKRWSGWKPPEPFVRPEHVPSDDDLPDEWLDELGI